MWDPNIGIGVQYPVSSRKDVDIIGQRDCHKNCYVKMLMRINKLFISFSICLKRFFFENVSTTGNS